MTRKLILAATLGALVLPMAAQAHTTRAELRHDAAQVREEHRELHAAKREMREDLNDWRRTHRR